ncbi:hypothetical protein AALO_G00231630 [Alosa alosa]|uniref:FHA domain-containing protein n=1 Tax=Alosa alosa TaxID=278164 RepID=A0AAV6FX84_9TELE|nr:hypothetical protein AALO_G00231630 [Alosa alosa]
MSLTSWFLVSSGGTRHRLPREMIFVGRDDCELMLQSRSVDKQHAVINYELASDEHKVKDLGSLNGTFVNDVRIQEQTYITLKTDDKLRRFANRKLVQILRRELHVPEEALKHEKFTSQLQLGKKPTTAEPAKTPKTKPAATKTPERKAAEPIMEPPAKPAEPQRGDEKTGDIAALHRGTPLYGQPSWWGDGDADDENSFKQETKTCGKKQENCGIESREGKKGEKERAKENGLASLGTDPGGYLELASKEGSVMASNNNGSSSIHEVPTKDTEDSAASATNTAATAGSSQGHASFTIEFDAGSPGKVTIKDHVAAKLSGGGSASGRAKKSGPTAKDLSTLQAAMMASETKVADWLAQNDPPLVRRESAEDDNKTINSDVPVHFRRLKGSKHADGTQSDSENGPGLRFGSRRQALEERLRAGGRTAPLLGVGVAGVGGGGVASAGEGLCPTPPPARPKAVAMESSEGGKGSGSAMLRQRSEEPSASAASRSSVATGKSASPTEETQKLDGGDDQSDKGTYTIEQEIRNPEEEEARRMIDKVFGVEGRRDPSSDGQHPGEGKPSESKKPSSKTAEVVPDDQVAVGSPHWVSQWASLTANHTRTDPEGSGAEPSAFVHQEREPDAFESSVSQRSGGSTTSSLTERKRRTLPQLPAEEKPKLAKGLPLGSLGLRSEIGEKQDTEPQEKENGHKGDGQSLPSVEKGTANGVVAPSEGKGAGKRSSEEGGVGGRRRRGQEGRGSGSESEKSGRPLVRQGSFTMERPSMTVPAELIPIIGRGGGEGAKAARERSDSTGSMDTATLLKDTEAVMAFLEAKLRDEGRQEKKPLPPGGSVTSGSKGHHHRPARTGGSISPESDVDTNSTVSQTAGCRRPGAGPAARQRRSLSSLHREKSNASAASVAATRAAATTARDRLERKASKSRPSTTQTLSGNTGTHRGRQPSLDLTDDDQTSSHALSTMSDVLSSDQDTPSSRSYGRGGHFASTDDLLMLSKTTSSLSAKTSRASRALHASSGSLASRQTHQQQQAQQAGLPTPRPTRASLLRRARLGDASDTDLADADRVSVASEVSTTSSTSRPPSGRKAPSRIDMLAQPRRTRLGSISARSDSEATVGVRSAASRVSAETALRLGLRQPAPGDGKLTQKSRASSISKLNEVKAKVAPPTHGSPSESPEQVPETLPTAEEIMVSSRWRRLTPEYASTSEDEFGSNRSLSKHGRPLRAPPALRGPRGGLGGSGSAPPTPGAGSGVLKHRMREHDEYIRDWTAHSEEIARISQDLAKDLAILAREIHDVAGEIDSVSSSGTAPSTTVSTAATTPGSAIDTREELVDRVFDESLNFRKIPPVVQTKAPEINGRPVELRPRAPDSLDPNAALRRRTWNRDEAVLDSLLLTSVSQLSGKIRQSVDKTAAKIRILFKDKDRNWDDIETKLRAESDIPLLKTSNKEISSILLELKRVEKQLQVINVMVDPDGTLDALTSLGLTSPVLSKPRPSPSSQTPPAPLPGPGATKAPSGATSPGDCQRSLGLGFTRTLPSGEEAAAVASK